ncbi:MAG: hypothetical protein ACO26F_01355 [Burkholderiaceae bacterium]|jgi:hypothetical protein
MMIPIFSRPCSRSALGAAILLGSGAAVAQSSGTAPAASAAAAPVHWRAVAAPYAPHIRPSDEHADVWAIGLERQRADQWLAGGSFFSNSFGQPSTYLYVGKRFPALLGHPQLFGQLSGGLMYGYRGQYQGKVPFNYNGFSPGALASIGWQFNRELSLTVHAVGDAAVMFQFGWDFR